jgi:UDP-N-acetylmuramoyl-tripeptide--D-alanyl-D-alanine ligase
MKLILQQIAEWTHAVGHFDALATTTGYSIDSRTVTSGDLFFAVKGEQLDGHEFVAAALGKGAVAAVVEAERIAQFPKDFPLLGVENTLTALQTLGAAVRKHWGKPLIGVTGSAGKTTTKELLATVLGARYKVLKSQGNLNNHFGLPLQLLKLEPEHDIAVIEMGMNHPGEITTLAALARPNAGVVTCVAPVHIEFFKSIAEIAKAKKELIDALPDNGTAILNGDDDYVSKFGAQFNGRVVTFGINVPADVRAHNVQSAGAAGSKFEVVTREGRFDAELPLIGTHNIYNALAALAAGIVYDVPASEGVATLAGVTASDKRGEIIEVAGATVINDCYNSNPKALESMIDALATMPAKGRRIVIAGEMLELGAQSETLHRKSGQHAARRNVDMVIGVRGNAGFIVEGAREIAAQTKTKTRAEYLPTPQAAGEWLAREVRPGDVVLLKASRGVKLEQALDTWKTRPGAPVAKAR